MARLGLLRNVSTFDPCLFFIFRETGSAGGAFTTLIDDILGRGQPDALPKVRDFSQQLPGALKLRESPFLQVGTELAQDVDFSETLTQDYFARNWIPLSTTPRLWAARQKTPSIEDIK